MRCGRFTFLHSLLMLAAAGGCSAPTDPVPAPDTSAPPATTLQVCADPDHDSFCFAGEDPDGDLRGFEYQLARVDDAYVDSNGASGNVLGGVDPVNADSWSGVHPDDNVRFRLGPGAYRFRVRAVDRAGNRDPTPAEHLWRRASDKPAIRIQSGCGGLFPDPAPLVMTLQATDLRYDQTPTPVGDLSYSWELLPEDLPPNDPECPVFPIASDGWIPFPADGSPPRIRIDELGDATIVPAGNGRDAACRWRFYVSVQDLDGNTGWSVCSVMILQ